MNEVLLNDRYQLDRLLGRKSGRRTWLSIDRQTQQQVVIKLLLFSSDFEWDALKLFERESKTLQDLNHSAIPKYLDWFETSLDGNTAFALVQTYIPAPSLDAVVRSGRTFSSDDLRNIAEQVLQILDYLHSRNPYVIHRDLKPSNLLLGDRTGNSPGMIYLVDFGSVQNLAIAKGGTMTIVGTYGYMPPEQFGDRAVPASDLYSLGATLIYLATGEDPADLLSDDFQIQCDSMNHLEPNFRNWIQGLVVTSLRDRPSSVQEAIDRLVHPKIKGISGEDSLVKSTSVSTQRMPEEENFRFKMIEHSNEVFVLSIPSYLIKVVQHRSLIRTNIPYGILEMMIIPFWICMVIMALPTVNSLVATFISFFSIVPVNILSISISLIFITIAGVLVVRQGSRILIIDKEKIYLTQKLNDEEVRQVKRFGAFDNIPGMSGVLHKFLMGRDLRLGLKERIWEIEFISEDLDNEGMTTTIFYINLKVASEYWRVQGNLGELRWLLGELSHYLQIEPTLVNIPEQ